MLGRVSLGVLLAVSLAGTEASAQTAQKFSLQGSFLGVQLTGIANDELAFGGGGEIQIRYNPGAFSIGVGGQTTLHELDGNTITFKGGFLEPRYVFLVGSDRVAPYLSARLMTLEARFLVLGIEATREGSAVSGGGGLLVRLGSRLNADLGLTFGKESYGGEATEGVTVVTRLGIALGLG
jgi:hypothetical protein